MCDYSLRRIRDVLLDTSIGILSTIFMILIGCGASESPPELPEIEYKLVITDSIGVESGDAEYILGWPVSPTYTPHGNIAILDRMKHAAFIYTPEGEFIRTIGQEGSGPGEFHLPSSLAFYSDGRLLIGDQDGIALFDSSYELMETMTWPLLTPSIVSALDSGGFIGTESSPRMEEDGLFVVSTLVRWDGEQEPSVEYFTVEFEWDVDDNVIDFTKSRGRSYLSCAARSGRVFYSQSSIDKFVIHGCEPDGTHFLLIEDDNVHRIRKTEDELQAELEALYSLVNSMTGGSPRPFEVKLDPYKSIIRDMFIIDEEMLWVRLGCYPGIIFSVYDFSGEILFHAKVEYTGNPVDLNSWVITGDEHGFLRYNQSHDQYQRVYMLELREIE